MTVGSEAPAGPAKKAPRARAEELEASLATLDAAGYALDTAMVKHKIVSRDLRAAEERLLGIALVADKAEEACRAHLRQALRHDEAFDERLQAHLTDATAAAGADRYRARRSHQ